MKLFVFGNNEIAWRVIQWLREQEESIVGLALHPPEKRRCGDEILRQSGADPAHVFDGARLHEPGTVEAIRRLGADLALSLMFGYILPKELLDVFPRGVVNLHPAYLPYNRGAYPNVWSIVEGTPAGVTLHYLDEGVDTGDVIARRAVPVASTDTGESLYRRLEQASVQLFRDTWPLIRTGQAPRMPQGGQGGTSHRLRDVESIDEIDLRRPYVAQDLINILRARTFPPYKGAYILVNGKRIYLRLQLDETESP